MALGPRSERVKAARRLHRRACRSQARRFLAEGPQAVREAALAGALTELYATPDGVVRHADVVESAGVRVTEVTDDAMSALASTVTPQGIAGVCRFVDTTLAAVLAAGPRLVVVLVEVADPGNAGTVLRTADAAGADAVVLTAGSVDVYNGKCVRSTAGSLFHLPVVTGPAAVDAVDAVRAAGVRALGADARGERSVDDLDAGGELARPTAWLFGNEAHGLPAEVRAAADAVVRIPVYGRAESLNLSVSAAICMYRSASAQRSASAVVRHGDRP
ncbi:MAG: RNA methyltransferase [Streptosporangiales bacterium]|nr:RNA methyltransferase [Streptosporangiales bacterium]